MTKKKPALLLFPNVLGDVKHHEPFLPAGVDRAVGTIDGVIAESERGGRRFLSRFDLGGRKASDVPIAVFDGKRDEEDLDFYLKPIADGERWGMVSDCGLPCVADPGSLLVMRAHQRGINVQAYVGPSAAMMALMLSGLPGQRFAFRGYPAKASVDRRREFVSWESASARERATQLFIEAPHRNAHALGDLVETLKDDTLLSVAWDLTLPSQGVMTYTVKQWKGLQLPNLDKKPTMFLLYHETK